MQKKKYVLIILYIILILSISLYFFIFSDIPDKMSITKDKSLDFKLNLPLNIFYIKGEEGSAIKINGKPLTENLIKVNTGSSITVSGEKIGQSIINFRLFGLIPIRSISVNVLPEIEVMPGGQAIGVLLRNKGVMVVGKSQVNSKDGIYAPAQQAGIEVGDTILKVNGQEIYDKIKLASLIQNVADENKKISLLVRKKKGDLREIKVKPVQNRDGIYMIGLYVDDGVAGVGTLTFYKPETKEYGALGHVITESNSGIKIEVRDGRIVEAKISGINYGRKGIPGEKRGTFYSIKNVLGTIEKNTDYGIYGRLERLPQNPFFDNPVPVATISQVKRGPAKIYTVVEDGKIEEYIINIDKVYRQTTPGGRGMVITISDHNLKKKTGGIIQGMSGSPIIQNGKLVGAVTHVFVNNPLQGYGVFAEWMLLETKLYKSTIKSEK